MKHALFIAALLLATPALAETQGTVTTQFIEGGPLQLTLEGDAARSAFGFLTVAENAYLHETQPDGSTVLRKVTPGVSCTKLISKDRLTTSYTCVMYMDLTGQLARAPKN